MKHIPLAPAVPAALLMQHVAATTAKADMLGGGLLDAVFNGGTFTGPRLLDLAIIGVLIFFVFRLFTKKSGSRPDDSEGYLKRPDQTDADQGRQTRPAPPPDAPQDGEQELPDAHRAAEAAWDRLRSRQDNASAPSGPSGSSRGAPAQAGNGDGEFLAGAKAAYARIRESLDKNDLEDVRSFTTPAFMEELAVRAKTNPGPGDMQIMLINAKVMEQKAEGTNAVAEVYYDTLIKRRSKGDADIQLREIWRFTKDNANPNANWLLDDIRQVQ